jgi:uncharacterized protein YndB with AHSA1/START domain
MTLPRSERGPALAAERADAEQVTRSVDLDAAPAAVWDALTEDALLAEWLADEVEIEAEPGGAIVCRYADGEERRGEVELVEEAERLAWSWRREGGEPSRVELTLGAVAGGTRLTVIETVPLRANGPLLVAGSAGPRRRSSGPTLAAVAGPAPIGAPRVLPLGLLASVLGLVLA